MAKKPKISVEIELGDYNLFKWFASRNHQTLSEWVRKTLFDALPQNAAKMMNAESIGRATVAAAFKELDKEDAIDLGARTGTVVVPVPPPEIKGHPCRWLERRYSAGYGPGQCEGTCSHRAQPGRVCFWVESAAPDCPHYMPGKVR